jgi:glycosyltransferase involved in cell wall biosynthesis
MSKILFVGNYPPPLSGQAIAFKLIYDEYSIEEKSFLINTIEKQGRRSVFFRLIDYLRVFIKLIYYLVFIDIDQVYHIISSNKIGFYRDYLIINISKLFNKRLVIHSHNGNYGDFYNGSNKSFQNKIKKTIDKVDSIILLSEKLRNTFYFIEDEKFSFIPNGLPQEIIKDDRQKKRLNKEQINILFLSNLIESKGYLDILEALRVLKEKGQIDRFKIHLAGSFMLNMAQDESYKSIDEAKNLFFGRIKEYGLDEYLEYHGVVYGEKKDSLLKTANVFLLPTYYNVEAQPITIIEAMAYGLAIYSTNYRAIPDMLIDKYNGEFIEQKKPLKLAEKLADISIEKLEKYSSNSLALFETKFTKKIHVDSMISLLKNTDFDGKYL